MANLNKAIIKIKKKVPQYVRIRALLYGTLFLDELYLMKQELLSFYESWTVKDATTYLCGSLHESKHENGLVNHFQDLDTALYEINL